MLSHVSTFSRFRNNGVPTVNESWGCATPSHVEGMVEDYFARNAPSGPLKILVVKSAGNDDSGTLDSNYYGNRACERTMNGLCVGATTSQGAGMMKEPAIGPTYGSSWLNPGLPANSDREEPDLAAFGSSVVVATITQPTLWQNVAEGLPVSGTSFAAPIITTEATLMRQYARPRGSSPGTGRSMRAPCCRPPLSPRTPTGGSTRPYPSIAPATGRTARATHTAEPR